MGLGILGVKSPTPSRNHRERLPDVVGEVYSSLDYRTLGQRSDRSQLPCRSSAEPDPNDPGSLATLPNCSIRWHFCIDAQGLSIAGYRGLVLSLSAQKATEVVMGLQTIGVISQGLYVDAGSRFSFPRATSTFPRSTRASTRSGFIWIALRYQSRAESSLPSCSRAWPMLWHTRGCRGVVLHGHLVRHDRLGVLAPFRKKTLPALKYAVGSSGSSRMACR